jgi:hypothetical protein
MFHMFPHEADLARNDNGQTVFEPLATTDRMM